MGAASGLSHYIYAWDMAFELISNFFANLDQVLHALLNVSNI